MLARKWRPRNFLELVGQDHVRRALTNALDHGRLHHAYLFTGTRGVGKTTIARILAKSLNCERGITSTPCGECRACREIDEGRFIDLIEVDAASRTKVEDTRELLDNVQYAPTSGRYKVYLIDEVHMLSRHSFNALLKTLEEPPPHIKFLLATTDPQKLPVTILSRCLQFNLKRLTPGMIDAQLEHILQAEAIDFEPAAVRQLAHAADGSMRDALSLLDQAIAFGGGHLSDSDVRSMLGSIDRHHVFAILEALANTDATALLTAVHHAAEQAPDFAVLLEELLSLLHHIALAQLVPGSVEDDADDEQAVITDLAQRLAPEDVQLYYQIGLTGRRDLPVAPDARSGFEMTLLRMLVFRPQTDSPAGTRTNVKPAVRAASTPAVRKQVVDDRKAPDAGRQPSPVDWGTVVEKLALTGMLHQLAVNCELELWQDDKIRLRLDEAHVHLGSTSRTRRLEQCLRAYTGKALDLDVVVAAPEGETPALSEQRRNHARQQRAEAEIRNNVQVKKLQEVFNATIVAETIQPNETG